MSISLLCACDAGVLLAIDPDSGGVIGEWILIAANVGEPSIPDSYSVSVVDLARRERIAEVKVPGRTRWAIYDESREMFFVNIAAPAQIIAIRERIERQSVRLHPDANLEALPLHAWCEHRHGVLAPIGRED